MAEDEKVKLQRFANVNGDMIQTRFGKWFIADEAEKKIESLKKALNDLLNCNSDTITKEELNNFVVSKLREVG